MAFSGAMVRKAVDQTGANYTTATAVAWATEVFDEGGWFDTGVSTTVFTVPSGVSKVRVGASIRTANVSVSDWLDVRIRKNGSATFDGASSNTVEPNTATGNRSCVCGPVSCSPGDTFDVTLQTQGDTSIDITATQSNFWIEKVDD